MNTRNYKFFYTISFLGSFVIGLCLIDLTDLKAEGNIKALVICSASILLWLFSIWILERDKRRKKQKNPQVNKKKRIASIVIVFMYAWSLAWLVYAFYSFFDDSIIKSISSLITSVLFAIIAFNTKKNLREEFR